MSLDAATCTLGEPDEKGRKWYLVVANVSKKNNVVELIRAASAYSLIALVVKSPKIDIEAIVTESGGQTFNSLAEVSEFLRVQEAPLFGIEILNESINIWDFPFHSYRESNLAFMPGNEGTGLSEKQKKVCCGFLYIPQYGSGTASLNVSIATTIVLHHLAIHR